MKASPNRFTKTSQGRSWNTGNGSPDAICLNVDKPGVVLVGVCVYGGGGIHEYELEVLADDVSNINHFSQKDLFIISFFVLLLLGTFYKYCVVQILCVLSGTDRTPRGLSTFSQMDVPGVGKRHLQH